MSLPEDKVIKELASVAYRYYWNGKNMSNLNKITKKKKKKSKQNKKHFD